MFCMLEAGSKQHIDEDTGHYYYDNTDKYSFTKTINSVNEKAGAVYMPYYFRVASCNDYSSLAELYPIASQWVENRSMLMIRAALIDTKSVDYSYLQRLAINFNNDIKSKIITMDIDELQLPKGIKSTDIEKQGRHVIQLLHKLDPQTFPLKMPFIAQASSSAGLAYHNQVKLHMYIENSVAISQAQAKTIFANINELYKEKFNTSDKLVDLLFYSRVQQNYTARPIFRNPNEDPFAKKPRIIMGNAGNRNTALIPSTTPVGVTAITISDTEQDNLLGKLSGRTDAPWGMLKVRLEILDNWEGDVSGVRNHVITIFHSGMQQLYDLDKLEGLCIPLIRKARPDLIMENSSRYSGDTIMGYINQGRKRGIEGVKATIDRNIPTDHGKRTKIHKLEVTPNKEHHLKIKGVPEKNSITFIKASLGTGKTYTVAKWKEDGHLGNGTFLSLTDSISLVTANCAAFKGVAFNNEEPRSNEYIAAFKSGEKITLYKEECDIIEGSDELLNGLTKIKSGNNKGKIAVLGTVKSISGTIQSIHKLKGLKFDNIFIDEGDSVFQTIQVSSTMGSPKSDGPRKLNIVGLEDDSRIAAWGVMGELLHNSDRLMVADGDLDGTSVPGYLDLAGVKKKINSVTYCPQRISDANVFMHKSSNSVLAHMHRSLAEGKKCLLVSDMGPSKIEQIRISINNSQPEKVVECIHGDTYKKHPIIDKVLSGKKNIFGKTAGLTELSIDAILCSPSVTSGIDWSYFDVTYVITQSRIHTPCKRFQAAQRCRDSREFHVFTDSRFTHYLAYDESVPDLPTNPKDKAGRLQHYRGRLAARDKREYSSYVSAIALLFLQAGATVSAHPSMKLEEVDMQEALFEYYQNCVDIVMTATVDDSGTPVRHKDMQDCWELKTKTIPILMQEPNICDQTVLAFFELRPDKQAAILSDFIHEFYSCVAASVALGSAKPFFEETRSRKQDFYFLTNQAAFKNEEEAECFLARSGVYIESDIKTVFDTYKLYIEEVSNSGHVMPTDMAKLYNKKELERISEF